MPAFCAQADSEAADGDFVAHRAAEFVRIEFQPVVAAGDDHGQQARMDLRLFGGPSRAVAAHRCPPAATAVPGDRLRPLPGWAGDVSVINIHEQSPSEACPITDGIPRSVPVTASPHRVSPCPASDPADYRPAKRLETPLVTEYAPSGVAISNKFLVSRAKGLSRRHRRGRRGRPRPRSEVTGQSASAGKEQSNGGIEDNVGAFVPGPRARQAPLGSGRLSGLSFAVKDLFDIAGA